MRYKEHSLTTIVFDVIVVLTSMVSFNVSDSATKWYRGVQYTQHHEINTTTFYLRILIVEAAQ